MTITASRHPMTAAEHAKVWRKAAQKEWEEEGDASFANFCDRVATAYEQAAKEQEGRE